MFRSRYILLSVLLTIVSSMCFGEGKERTEEKGKWTENIFKIKYGFNNTLDPYLSPLRYNGQQIGLGQEWWGMFEGKSEEGRREEGKSEERRGKERWGYYGRLDLTGQRAYSSAKNNLFYGLGAQGGWGAYCQWQLLPPKYEHRLNVMVGPYLQADIRARQHASEVNKPYSADVAMDIMATAGINWIFSAKKSSYKLQYLFRTNLMGMQFMPDYWEAYYEVYKNKLSGNIHFAAPHNRNHICQQLTMDFQFQKTTWRLGVEHEWLGYGSREMRWQRNEVSIVVGCLWQNRTGKSKL